MERSSKSTLPPFVSLQGPQGTRELARSTVWASVGGQGRLGGNRYSPDHIKNGSTIANPMPRHRGGEEKKIEFFAFSGVFCDFFYKFVVSLCDL
jgi:hypothetical protein